MILQGKKWIVPLKMTHSELFRIEGRRGLYQLVWRERFCVSIVLFTRKICTIYADNSSPFLSKDILSRRIAG